MKFHLVHVTACAALLLTGAAAPPSGVDVSAMDRSVRPGEDFDAFASGAWRARTQIPPDKQSTGTIEALTDQNQARIRSLIEEAALRPTTSDARLIGDLYAAYMDEARVEALGEAPLRRHLDRVRALSDKGAVAEFMGRTQSSFGRGFFICDVWVDLKDPSRPALRLRQDGLGLGYKEAYGDPETLDAYRAYISRTLALIGWPGAEQAAADIVRMEQRIAEGSWTTAENMDRVRRYNPMTPAELQAFAPGFDWPAYFHGLDVGELPTVFVQQKSAMPKIAAVFANMPLETLKAWAAFQLADDASPYLPKRFSDNRFSFRGKVQQGLEAEEPRWKRAVDTVNDTLPHAVGREFVTRYLSAATVAEVEAMAENFRAAMAKRIRAADWMAPATKAAAQKKLARIRFMVGRPANWRDYSELKLDRADLYGDVVKARAFNWSAETAKLSRPADPGEWFLAPQGVDGFSDQSRVAVGVLAGVLQPPIFDPGVDSAANYGALGELLGHELTHQFDDQGRKYGASGALEDWWTLADATRFEQVAGRLADQFGAIEIAPGVRLNGRQTLSENIADLGGLLLALDAYRISLKGKPAPVIAGLTGEQRVFLAWARVFRSKERPESLREQALGGTHTPFKFRVIGPTRNIDAWYTDFGVKPGDRYYVAPEDRVRSGRRLAPDRTLPRAPPAATRV